MSFTLVSTKRIPMKAFTPLTELRPHPSGLKTPAFPPLTEIDTGTPNCTSYSCDFAKHFTSRINRPFTRLCLIFNTKIHR